MSRRVVLCVVPVVLFVFATFESPASAQQPIPKGPDCYTELKFNAELLQFLERQFGDYRTTTADPPAAHDAAAAFLQAYLLHFCGTPSSQTDTERFNEGRRLLQLGARDRRVLLAMAVPARRLGQYLAAKQTLDQVLLKPADKGCPSLVLALAQSEMLRLAKAAQQSAELKVEGSRLMAEALRAWMVDTKPTGVDLRFAWSFVWPLKENGIPMTEMQQFYDVLAHDERLDPWYRSLLAGTYLKSLAWDKRGPKWAHLTSEEQMRGFGETLAQAVVQLEKAHGLIPKFPEPAAMMIGVAMGGGGEREPREWFDLAVAAQMDYPHAYYALIYAMQPRWGGSYNEMFDFSLECLETDRFDTNVPCTLGIMIDRLEDERDDLLAVPQVYETLTKMLTELYRRHNWAVHDSWRGNERDTRTWHAAAAVLTDHYADARVQFELIGENFPKKTFADFGLQPDVVRGRTYALTGPAGETVAAIRAVLDDRANDDRRTDDELIGKFAQVAARDPHPITLAYCASVVDALKVESAFYTGNELTLRFAPGLNNYTQRSGMWKAESDHVLIGMNDGTVPELEIKTHAQFWAPYVMSCTVEYAANAMPHFYPTITAGYYPHGDDSDLRGVEFMLASQSSTFGISRELSIGDMEESMQPYPHRSRHQFRCELWPGYMRAMLDGDILVDRPAPRLKPFGRISFGTTEHGARGAVRISDVRIRKLHHAEPPPQNLDERLKYFDELVRAEPANARAAADRGSARFELKRLDEALQDFRLAIQLEPDTPRFHLLLARALFFGGRHLEAKNVAEEYLKKHPRSPDMLLYLTDLQTVSDQPGVADVNQALQHAENAGKMVINLRWWEYLSWAAALSKSGNLPLARAKAALAVEKSPEEMKAKTTAVFDSLTKGTPYQPSEHQGIPLKFMTEEKPAAN